jgi:Ca-activated chloride channel family protein
VSFQAPLILAALVLVPVAVWLYLGAQRRRRAAVAAFAAAPVLPSAAPSQPGWRRHAPMALYGLALAGLITALARPQATIAVPAEQASVMLVTDISGSMQATDVAPNRLTAAKRAAVGFVEEAPDDLRIGALAYNQTPRALASPSTERAPLIRAIERLEPSGSTATGDALTAALRPLTRPVPEGTKRPPAAIILLSDGKSVRGGDPLVAARAAADAGIPVHTVALGTETGTIPSRDGGTERVPPDRETLGQIAQLTGGQALATADPEELASVYDELGSQVTQVDEEREVTAAFAGGSALLLLAGALMSLRWFGRLP